MNLRNKPHYTVSAKALADWIEEQPNRWWSVDGDPLLSSILDFPCPGDEIAPAIRKIGKSVLILAKDPHSRTRGELIQGGQLDEFSALSDKGKPKILHLSWADADAEWLLLEDKAMIPT